MESSRIEALTGEMMMGKELKILELKHSTLESKLKEEK